MHIRSEKTDRITQEYGGSFRRLYPWADVVSPPWGAAIMVVEPGGASTPHNHDEEETFIFVEGEGLMVVNDEERQVANGDVVYLPRFSQHFVRNTSKDVALRFLCIWWGAPDDEKSKQQISPDTFASSFY